MNLFINTAYNKIELFYFKENYKKLFVEGSKNNHTKKLYENINYSFDDQKIDFKDIKKLYVVTGPGSYTGLRIGIVFGKTLAMTHNIEIYPINYLEILYKTNGQNVGVDARGNKFFIYNGIQKKIENKFNINDSYLLDAEINYNKLIENLKEYKPVPYKEIVVEYFKNAI